MAHLDQVRSGPFSSILFADAEATAGLAERAEPDCFHNLNLDQVVSSITSGREEYDLAPFFYTPLTGLVAINYRHEVLRDLDRAPLLEHVESFARKMRLMRERLALAHKLHYKHQKQRWHLDAVATYCEATTELAAALSAARLTSAGFLSLREYLTAYLSSTSFRSLLADTTQLRHDLDQVRYSLHIRGNHIRVRKYDGEPDYSEDVDRTFAKFKQHADKDYRVRLSDWPDMNHVEAGVLDLAAKLYPETFLTLETYCQRYQEFVDDMIGRFDREIQFYVAYLEYVRPIRGAGLKFCYPKVSSRSKEVRAYETFDIALARMLSLQGLPVVSNDFQLNEPERILVVSGPNQGGKTTLARTFGQLHYLARVGCPVPGRSAQLFLYDQLFTHFEKEEDIGNLRGKLQDDLVRIREILDSATAGSLIVINEIFDSTTLKDAVFLGREIMARIVDLDALCVYVTFIVELASVSETTVSMVSTVNPANPAQRTYKLMRRPADGLAYATAIAEKYGLTYDSLRRRIAV